MIDQHTVVPDSHIETHEACGGQVTYSPAAWADQLRSGATVTLTGICNACGQMVSTEYALSVEGGAPGAPSAPVPVPGATGQDPAPAYFDDFARRFAAAKGAIERMRDELPDRFTDESLAQPSFQPPRQQSGLAGPAFGGATPFGHSAPQEQPQQPVEPVQPAAPDYDAYGLPTTPQPVPEWQGHADAVLQPTSAPPTAAPDDYSAVPASPPIQDSATYGAPAPPTYMPDTPQYAPAPATPPAYAAEPAPTATPEAAVWQQAAPGAHAASGMAPAPAQAYPVAQPAGEVPAATAAAPIAFPQAAPPVPHAVAPTPQNHAAPVAPVAAGVAADAVSTGNGVPAVGAVPAGGAPVEPRGFDWGEDAQSPIDEMKAVTGGSTRDTRRIVLVVALVVVVALGVWQALDRFGGGNSLEIPPAASETTGDAATESPATTTDPNAAAGTTDAGVVDGSGAADGMAADSTTLAPEGSADISPNDSGVTADTAD